MTNAEYNYIYNKYKYKLNECLLFYCDEHLPKLNNKYAIRDEKEPSCAIYHPKEYDYILIDFGNNKRYTIYSLYALKNNLDIKKDFKKIFTALYEKYKDFLTKGTTLEITTKKYIKSDTSDDLNKSIENDKKEDLTFFYNSWNKELVENGNKYTTKDETAENKAFSYIDIERGIKIDTINKYNIGYCKVNRKYEIYNQIIIPLNKHNFIARRIKGRGYYNHFTSNDIEDLFFNSQYIINSDDTTEIFITEGIIDSLSIEQLNSSYKVVALNSLSNIKKFLELLKKYDFKGTLYLIYDLDKPNEKGIRKSEEEFNKLHKKLNTLNIKNKIYDYDFIKPLWEERLRKGIKEKIDINNCYMRARELLRKSIDEFISNNSIYSDKSK